jgi:D-beta-D-heptose 7-phosphate kinase/D-beta-D-heptose 1-phosphate adenosyltransferase
MTDNAALAACLPALAGARVLCLGDVMLDRYIYGSVERISPEAPIPVLKVTREVAMLGGAGNVLRNLAALGVECDFLAVVGDDAAGDEIADLIGIESGQGTKLVVEPGRQTTIKERFVAASQQLLRSDRESASVVSADAADILLKAAEAIMRDGPGVLVLSDYGKGLLTPAVTAAAIAAARKTGWRVVVDPKGRDYGVYRGADIVTPNRRELAEASGLPTGSDDEVVAAGRAVMDAAGLGAILATRSEQGMTLVNSAGGASPAALHFPAAAREVFDVSGAGDTVVAVLAASLAAGVDLPQAARLANVAAGIVVGKLGTAVARPAEILHALHAAEFHAAEDKILDREGLVEQAGRWRAKGLRVGFTNGCFDLLHPGHVSLMAQARRACDRLVVGLNSDDSVRRLKGADRPVQSQAARAAVLASLADVAAVVIFDEDTPLALLEALRPDVLVKGADYTLDNVVGADLVQSYGGRVVLAELAEGHSTTGTIKRLKG